MNPKVLLDVRMNSNTNIKHLIDKFSCKEYIYIPFDELLSMDNIDSVLEKDKIYYVICNRGNKSKYICDMLEEKGYNVFNVEGGVEKLLSTAF